MLAAAFFASLAAVSSVRAAPIALLQVEAALSLPSTTQTNEAVYYYQNGNAGACTWYSNDNDTVVGLPTEFYSDLGAVSPYCGTYVVVTSPANLSVTARVADASATNETLSLSIATWNALNGTDSGLHTVEWRFANATEVDAAKAALDGTVVSSSAVWVAPSSTRVREQTSASSPASTSSSLYVAPSSSSSPVVVQKQVTSTSHLSSSTSTSNYVAPSSSSSSPAYVQKKVASSSTSTSSWAPRSTTTSYKPTTTVKAYVPPTTTSTTSWAPKTTTTTTWSPKPTTQAPKTTQSAPSYSSSSYSGRATFFTQGGNPGSCGNYNSDSTYLVAVNSAQMSSSLCGKTVRITNTANGKSITASVQDTCPGCSYGSLDLSTGAFGALGSYDAGVLPITWSYAS
ncbi:hypothetical protein JCM11641_003712 [Rhodosporidiobolus odoratus]